MRSSSSVPSRPTRRSPTASRRLAPDQRAAATAPPGPSLCVAPAGSGKTTTLVARVAWLVDGGRDPGEVAVVAFNNRAAEELTGAAGRRARAAGRAARRRPRPDLPRARSRDPARRRRARRAAGRPDAILRGCPGRGCGRAARLDTAFSRLKLDLGVTADEVAARSDARADRARVRRVRARGRRWRRARLRRPRRPRRCGLLDDAREPSSGGANVARDLLVDEAQDLDRTQLELALLLAAPANHVFLVGDDDQSIYGWRLADVRRVLGLAAALPGLRRVDLVTNYRCPRPVVERAVRLVEHNRERFAKRIVRRARPRRAGSSSRRTAPTISSA